MKNIVTILSALLITANVFAQSPQRMSYQAVIRNASNYLVLSTPVGMRVSILQGSIFGASVYVETQTPTTNANGLISVAIGSGTIVAGNFSTINWANGPYFIKTETDPLGGTAYSITGTTELMSVPYALYAGNSTTYTAGNGVSISSGTITNTAPNQTVTLVPSGDISILGSYPTYTISSPITPTLSLMGSGSTTVSGTYPTYTVSTPKILAGTSSGGFTPSMISGGGFTVTRVAQGIYDVVFTTPFSSIPTIVYSVHYNSAGDGSDNNNYFSKVYLKTVSGFRINTALPARNIDNIGFSIIATGN